MTHDLPQLTPDEATAVGILLVSRDPLAQVAAECGMSLLEFIALCSKPHVHAHINAARTLARKRADVIAQDARVTAVHTLQDIAAPSTDAFGDSDGLQHTTERRRAATTLLRAAQPRPSFPRRRVPRPRPIAHPPASPPSTRPPHATPARVPESLCEDPPALAHDAPQFHAALPSTAHPLHKPP